VVILTIYFKWAFTLLYNEMIQLFNTLIVPIPTDIKGVCTPSGSTSTTYGNWGYAQINSVILAPGQKYSIILQNPGYVVLNLGYYTSHVERYTTPGTPNWYYVGFNLNDYNNYVNDSNVKQYVLPTVAWNSLATAYAYVDSNGFVIDLTELPPQYAVMLGLLKFDYINQFSTATQNTAVGTLYYYAYGMSTALNSTFSLSGASNAQINTSNFLGIPINTTVDISFPNWTMGYQFNYNFLVNDETVSNNAFTYPTEQANVASIPQNTSIFVQSNGDLGAPFGTTTLNQFGSPQNITYNSVVGFSSTYNVISATGSEGASGIPNTNAIIDSNFSLAFPGFGGQPYELKSVYNNNGYNDIWVYSQKPGLCSPSSTETYIFAPYFTPVNTKTSSYFIQFNSSNPNIIYQYIAQAPIVQVNTVTTSSTTSSAPPTPNSYLTSSTPMTQASSSVSSTSTSQSTTTPSTTTSSTSTTTTTTVTQQIITALANPIVALILALALVGLALFVFV